MDCEAYIYLVDVSGKRISTDLAPQEAAFIVDLLKREPEGPVGVNAGRLLRLFSRIEELGY